MPEHTCENCRETFKTLTEKRLHDCSEFINEFELMEDGFREEAQAGIRELEEISLEEFTEKFSNVISLRDEFKNGENALLLQVSLDKEVGIDDYRLQHLDLSATDEAESYWDLQLEVTHFDDEEDDSVKALGINVLDFYGDEAPSLAPDYLKKALLEGLRVVEDAQKPSYYFQSNEPEFEFHLSNPTGGGFPESSPLNALSENRNPASNT